jgi:Mg-chelatase subunit ChlD
MVSFNDEARPLLPPNRNFDELFRAIERLSAGGGTSLAPALLQASAWLDRQFGRRSVLIVTDGQVSDSTAALEIAARMKASGVRFAAIGTFDADRFFLSRLASESVLGAQVADRAIGIQIEATTRALLAP